MTLSIFLFGSPRLSYNQQTLKLSAPPKTLPLLAYLLLHRQRLLERQQAAFALWPDEPEVAARANLRRHIHHLQRALPPAEAGRPWLIGDAGEIGWNPQADFWLDVAEFEQLSGQPDRLEAAAAMYTGDLIETVYDDWVFFERERLLNQYFEVLTQLIFQHRARRDYPKAIAYARQLLGRDTFREDTLRQLMTLRYESGDRAGAIQDYETFERRLRHEIGVAPMPETRALYELVLHNARLPNGDNLQTGRLDCDPASSEAEALIHRWPAPLLPFVGRESEMERLAAWWSRAAHGHGGLTLVSGEAGVGKTRLARQVALLVEGQGGRVLTGRTAPEESMPYQAIIEALRAALPLIEAQGLESLRLAILSALLPELKERRALPVLPALEADRERSRLYDAVAECLEQLAAPRPLLVILEDLHWAGEASAGLLEFLARRATRGALLILGTYRDEEAPRAHPLRRLRRRLRGETAIEHIALSRLSAEAVDHLLCHLPVDELPTAQPGQSLSARLYEGSEGNPLFIDMLIKSWREKGQVEDEIPLSIHAVITRRLEALPAAARAYAEAASVLGIAFDAEAAREIGGWDEAQAHNALRSLLDARLAREVEGRSRYDYTFAHHLIQSTLYTETPPAKRKRRHRRAAEVLAGLFFHQLSEMTAELAWHYDLGGAPEQALPHYLETTRQRLDAFADAEALAAARRALKLVEEFPSAALGRTPFDLLLLTESIHSRRGERSEQLAALQRLEQFTGGDPELTCEVLKRRIHYHKHKDEHDLQKQAIEALKTQAQASGSPRWQAEAIFAEGNYLKVTDAHQAAAERLKAATALFERLQDIPTQVMGYCLLAEIAVIQRQSSEAETWAEKALAICDLQQPASPLLALLWSLSANRLISTDLPRCLEHAQRLLEMAQQASDRVWQAAAHRLMGMAYQRQFRIAAARQSLHTALELYRLCQKAKGCALTLQSLGHVEVSVGKYDTARQHYLQAYQIQEQLQDFDGMANEAINLSYAAAIQEDYVTEKEYAQRGVALTRQIGNRFLEGVACQNLGEAERELGHLESANQHLSQALALLDDPVQTVERISVLADLALTQWKMNNLSLALQTVENILAAYPEIEGKDDNLHRFLWTAARVLHAAGQPERAAQVLAQAYRAFQKDLAVIPEDESRQAYGDIPHNRRIAAAYERGDWG